MADRSDQHRFGQLLVRYAFMLACSFTALVGLVLVLVDKALTWRMFLSAIGLNLFASIVFAIIFTVLHDRTREEVTRADLRIVFAELAEGLRQDLLTSSKTYLPSHSYREGEGFNNDFNRDLMEQIEKSRLYAFRGSSAKYVPQRIRCTPHPPAQLRIITLDPADSPSLRRRAADRIRQARNKDRPLPELVAELRNEIFMSITALFDIRELCPIELLLVAEPLVTRVELLDDSIFVSWYQGPRSTEVPFPEALRFLEDSFAYQVESLEISRRFEIGQNNVRRFSGDDNDDDLRVFLSTVRGSEVASEEIARWRTEYKVFIEPFDRMMRQLS